MILKKSLKESLLHRMREEPGLSESEHGAAGISEAVKTGDSTPTEVNLYLALLSLAAVILLLKEKRRKNR